MTSRLLASAIFALVAPLAGGTVIAQETAALFDAPVVVASDQVRIAALPDLDADGFHDALGWWWTDDDLDEIDITGLRNVAGQLTPRWEVSQAAVVVDEEPAIIDEADLTGDGRSDFVVCFGQRIGVYASNGFLAPNLLQTLDPGGTLRELALDDVDGDGLADLVTLSAAGQLATWMNDGGGGLALTDTIAVPASFGGLRLGSLTGDGVLDVLLVASAELRIHPLGSDGSILPRLSYLPPAPFLSPKPAIGDVDGDLDVDVVVFDELIGEARFTVLRRVGRNAFVLEPSVLGGPATDLADIDGDGDLDGVCCGSGGGPYPLYNDVISTFMLSTNDGTGAFAPSFNLPSLGATRIAGAVDMDHDGDTDLVAGRVVYYAPGPIVQAPGMAIGSGRPGPSEIVDFDGDGDPDFELALASVYRTMGDGTGYDHAPVMPDAPAGFAFHGPGYPGDFDGDGDEDLVVAMSSGGAFDSMRLLANTGGGGFVDAGPAGATGVSFSLTGDLSPLGSSSRAVDLDLDGDLDLLTQSLPGEWRTTTWRNDGSGFFTSLQDMPGNLVLATGDIDEDGNLDMVGVLGWPGSSNGLDQLFWFHGLGGGVFNVSSYYVYLGMHVAGHLDEVTLEDFNDDGLLDIVALHHYYPGDGRVLLWTNEGPPYYHLDVDELDPRSDWHEPSMRAMSADVNGDGWSDLVVFPVKHARNAVAIHLRKATGNGFQPSVIQQLLDPAAFVDMDGDGDVDAVAERWIPNRAYEGPSAGLRRQYGTGSPGSSGFVPVLGAVGPFRAGTTMEVRFTGGLGGALAQLVIGFSESSVADYPFQGMTGYAEPWFRRLPFLLGGVPGAPGEGSFTLVTEVPGALAGTNLFHQLYVFDAGAPNGVSSTAGLELRYE